MPHGDLHNPDDSTRKREGTGSKLLLEIATRDVFRRNAFRITGLSVNATAREISKQGDKLVLMQELGGGLEQQSSLLGLEPTPSLDELRHALQRMRNPENRILDEFFWFWPENGGPASTDPALCALARGDAESAMSIWEDMDRPPSVGFSDLHNLAVLRHALALDAEAFETHRNVTYSRREEIDEHWRNAFRYWQVLIEDDSFWDSVSTRIRQLNEPNLTTGYSRVIRSTLPRALNKISADVVMALAASGRADLARNHLDIVRDHANGSDGVEMVADCALAPVTDRLHEHIETARRRAEGDPSAAVEAARELLDHAEASLALYALFGANGESRKEIFDEVAGTVVNCAVDHQRKTEDNVTFVAVLERALPLAASKEVRQRVTKNIEIGRGNLNLELLQPVIDALRSIRESNVPPSAKLASIRHEILPKLTDCTRENPSNPALVDQLANTIAIALRGVSIEAHNDGDDLETALAAITVAGELAREAGLRKQIDEDQAQVLRNKQQREKNNLKLLIRSDEVEITHDRVRYNTATLPASDITGLRYGVFKQYTNGINTSTSYLIAVGSARHGSIEIECKRIFRSEDQAQSDFQAILQALYIQVVPALCERLAKQIAAGKQVAFGEWMLSAKGMSGSTGALFWKQDHLISWTDVRFGSHQGQLNISSSTNSRARASFSLRLVWNAPIFKELANAIVTELNRK